MPGFISLSYWFSLYPPALLFVGQIILLGVFVVLMALGLITLFVWRRNASSKERRQALSRIGHTVLWAGIVGLIWLLMTVTGVPVLGMRMWLVIGVVFFGWLLRAPIRDLRVTIPQQEQGAMNKASYEKWLPKPKK